MPTYTHTVSTMTYTVFSIVGCGAFILQHTVAVQSRDIV